MSKKKTRDDDSGFSYTDMNVKGAPWYKEPNAEKNRKALESERLSRKEQRAVIWSGFLRMLPILAIAVLSITIAFVLMWLWMK